MFIKLDEVKMWPMAGQSLVTLQHRVCVSDIKRYYPFTYDDGTKAARVIVSGPSFSTSYLTVIQTVEEIDTMLGVK